MDGTFHQFQCFGVTQIAMSSAQYVATINVNSGYVLSLSAVKASLKPFNNCQNENRLICLHAMVLAKRNALV